MKRITALLMAMALLLTLFAGCGDSQADANTGAGDANASTAGADAGNTAGDPADAAAALAAKLEVLPDDELYIGVSLPSMADEYMVTFEENFKALADPRGIRYEIQGADYSTIKQIEQIENMMSMGINTLYLWAVEVESCVDVLQKAKDAGIYVISGDGEIGYNTGAVDCGYGTDQYEYGRVAVEEAARWIDETFPDAEPGSIQVAVYSNPSSDKFILRQQALLSIADYTDKAVVVEEYNLAGEQNLQTKSQEYADLMVTNYPEVKVIICHSTSFGLAIDEVLQRTPSMNTDEIGIFCVDWLLAGAESIKKSQDGESCIRALSMLADSNNARAPFYLCTRELLPDDNGLYTTTIAIVNGENVDEAIANNS